MAIRGKKDTAADAAQSARFIEAARELGCDESPDAFEAAVKKVARHKPVEEKPPVGGLSPAKRG
jgi:alpha-beta hydrolase superfamily lysophospholipase